MCGSMTPVRSHCLGAPYTYEEYFSFLCLEGCSPEPGLWLPRHDADRVSDGRWIVECPHDSVVRRMIYEDRLNEHYEYWIPIDFMRDEVFEANCWCHPIFKVPKVIRKRTRDCVDAIPHESARYAVAEVIGAGRKRLKIEMNFYQATKPAGKYHHLNTNSEATQELSRNVRQLDLRHASVEKYFRKLKSDALVMACVDNSDAARDITIMLGFVSDT